MNSVFVLDNHKQPLSPCSPARARMLLQKGNRPVQEFLVGKPEVLKRLMMEMETGREQSAGQVKSIEQRIADIEEGIAKDKKIMEQEFENFKKVFDEKTTLITEILDEGPAEGGSPSTAIQMTIQTKDKTYDIFWSHPEPAEAEDIDVVPMGDSMAEVDDLRVDLGFGPEEEDDFSCPRLQMVSDFLKERYSVQELYDDCLKENYDGKWTHDPYRGWSFEENE